jgi:putative transposase
VVGSGGVSQPKNVKRKRRTHSAEFKARGALEVLKGINRIAQDEGIHPVHVSTWKKELLDRLPEVFASAASDRSDANKAERDRAWLERKVASDVV